MGLPKIPYDEWFDSNYKNPLDSMPIATDPDKYDPPCSVEPQEEENIHHKMYEIATSKYNPFSVGGSESIQDL